jgi:hypothetical protein
VPSGFTCTDPVLSCRMCTQNQHICFYDEDAACLLCGTHLIFNSGCFLSLTCFSPVSIIPPMLHTHLHLRVSLTRRINGRYLTTFRKEILIRKVRENWMENLFHFFLYNYEIILFCCEASWLSFCPVEGGGMFLRKFRFHLFNYTSLSSRRLYCDSRNVIFSIV